MFTGPVQRIDLDTLPVDNERQSTQFVCRVSDDGQVQYNNTSLNSALVKVSGIRESGTA